MSMFDKLKAMAERYRRLEEKIANPELMRDPGAYNLALRELGSLSKIVELHREYEELLQKEEELRRMAETEEDEEFVHLAREELEEMGARKEQLVDKLKRLLVRDDRDAGKNLILEIRAGTGGDEASLFAGDLFRMYQRFTEAKGLKLDLLEASRTEVGGFKEIILSVSGADAWDLLRFESGGHRVQRVPATESQGRIHTSAATVAVLPEAEEVEIDVKESDLKIETYRAGGPGGQNVNKVSSAIRITHLPTGLVVQCQDESSQHKNKSKALRILKARYYDMERSRAERERAEDRRGQIGTGDRNMRIRTYNFPQNRVTDHRVKKNYPLEVVMEGGLDKLLADLAEWDVEEKLKAL